MHSAWSELIRLPAPGAGQVVTYTIPGETFARLEFAFVRLVTDATAANRFVRFAILDGDDTAVFRSASSFATVANTTRDTSWTPGIGASAAIASGDELLPFADVLLPPGFALQFSAVNLQAADQFSMPLLYLRRFLSDSVPPAEGAAPYMP